MLAARGEREYSAETLHVQGYDVVVDLREVPNNRSEEDLFVDPLTDVFAMKEHIAITVGIPLYLVRLLVPGSQQPLVNGDTFSMYCQEPWTSWGDCVPRLDLAMYDFRASAVDWVSNGQSPGAHEDDDDPQQLANTMALALDVYHAIVSQRSHVALAMVADRFGKAWFHARRVTLAHQDSLPATSYIIQEYVKLAYHASALPNRNDSVELRLAFRADMDRIVDSLGHATRHFEVLGRAHTGVVAGDCWTTWAFGSPWRNSCPRRPTPSSCTKASISSSNREAWRRPDSRAKSPCDSFSTCPKTRWCHWCNS